MWESPFPLTLLYKKHGSAKYDKKALIPEDTGNLLGAPLSEGIESVLQDK